MELWVVDEGLMEGKRSNASLTCAGATTRTRRTAQYLAHGTQLLVRRTDEDEQAVVLLLVCYHPVPPSLINIHQHSSFTVSLSLHLLSSHSASDTSHLSIRFHLLIIYHIPTQLPCRVLGRSG